jgi:tripartite-type tricarboxylate transporter receptor subunit TctC
VLGNKAAQFDGRKFGWVGVPVADHGVCVTTKTSGVKTVEEWLASKRALKIGTVSPGSTAEDIPRLLQAALGLPMQIVSGYQGTTKIRLAIESGEVDGGCWGWESIKATWRSAIDSGDINVVIQPRLKSHPDITHVPLAAKYTKGAESKQLLQVLNDVYGETVRPYALPPATPKDRIETLQNAFLMTMKDSEFLAEAKKTQTDVDPISGSEAARIFASLYEYPPTLINRLKEILIPKK